MPPSNPPRHTSSARASGRSQPLPRARSPQSNNGRGRDRLAELQSRVRPEASPANYEMQNVQRSDARVQTFLEQIAALDSSLKRVQNNLDYIEKIQKRAGDTRLPDNEQEKNRHALEQASYEAKSNLTQYTAKFQSLESKLSQFTQGTADYVMCANQLTTLRKKHLAYVNQFHQLELGYSSKQKDKLLKELRVINPDATESDLDQLSTGQFFKQNMLQSNRYGQQALNQVKERHEEIQKVETLVEELAELFMDLSNLIQQQDFVVETIVQNADETVVNLEKGGEEVDNAIVYKKQSNKMKWIICVSVLLLLIGLGLYLALGPLKYLWSDTSKETKK